MLKKFKTKELIFLTLIGTLLFMVDFIISGSVDAVLGIKGIGYIISGFFFVIIGVVGALIVRKFFAFTIMATLYGVLSVPTSILGPPGIWKIPLAMVIGLFADLIVYLFKYRNLGYYFALSFGNILILPFWVWIYKLLGFPGLDKILAWIWIFVITYFIQGIVGSAIGIFIYEKKLKNKKIVKQIMS